MIIIKKMESDCVFTTFLAEIVFVERFRGIIECVGLFSSKPRWSLLWDSPAESLFFRWFFNGGAPFFIFLGHLSCRGVVNHPVES